MTFRRRKAPSRIGAGILLAAACTLAPAAAMAAPEDGAEPEPTQTQMCPPNTVKPTEGTVAPDESFSFEGCGFTPSADLRIDVVDDPDTNIDAPGSTDTDGAFDAAVTFAEPGEYTINVTVNDGQFVQAQVDVEVTEPEPEPEDPDESENPENPEDPENPEEPGEPGEPGNGDDDRDTDEGDATSPGTGEEGGGEDGADDGTNDEGDNTEGGGDTGTDTEDDDPGDENGTDGDDQAPGGDSRTEDDTSNPTGDAPGDDSTPLPSASDDPSASAGEPAAPQEPASPEAPASPDTPPNEAAQPDSGPTAAQQRSLNRALELGDLLAGMNRQSGESSDGEEELAATGVELSAGAALAFVTLGSGAGLVWTQRRPREY